MIQPMTCVHCGDTRVLTILTAVTTDGRVLPTPYDDPCHCTAEPSLTVAPNVIAGASWFRRRQIRE